MATFRGKIGGVPVEIDYSSQQELETVLAAMYVAVVRRAELTFPEGLQTPREQRTVPEKAEHVSGSPPQPQAEGGTPLLFGPDEKAIKPTAEPPLGTHAEVEQDKALYEGAVSIADYIEKALIEKRNLEGGDMFRFYTYREILTFLVKTGGDAKIKNNKDRIQALRQAVKNDNRRFVRDTDVGRFTLRQWISPTNTPETT